MSTTDEQRGEPITTVLTWQVRPGHEGEFEEWTHGITRCARQFTGNEGVSWLRPEDSHRFHVVLRFADPGRLTEWLRSPERAEWHAKIEGIAREVSSERQSTTGMETWFSLPGTSVRAPARWKMVLTTFLGAFPCVLLIQWLVTPRTAAWPLPLRSLVFPVLLLPLLTYVIMPSLSRLLRLWLYPPPDGLIGSGAGKRATGTRHGQDDHEHGHDD
ncbi:antibiotic biosynthesis monooxygenase [Streptomyces sp. NPDC059785]|uniref:antibiotic biosynthesis monooxygenase n=1 Tax=Streptomyces sp. NPDC059785 TaxID=3346945 RepID=UPI003648DBB4